MIQFPLNPPYGEDPKSFAIPKVVGEDTENPVPLFCQPLNIAVGRLETSP